MVGYELLAETQRDLTAEEAAERLRAVQLVGSPVVVSRDRRLDRGGPGPSQRRRSTAAVPAVVDGRGPAAVDA